MIQMMKPTKLTPIPIQTTRPTPIKPTSKATSSLQDLQTEAQALLPHQTQQQQALHPLSHQILLLKTQILLKAVDRPKAAKTSKIALQEETDVHAYDRNKLHNLYKKKIL